MHGFPVAADVHISSMYQDVILGVPYFAPARPCGSTPCVEGMVASWLPHRKQHL